MPIARGTSRSWASDAITRLGGLGLAGGLVGSFMIGNGVEGLVIGRFLVVRWVISYGVEGWSVIDPEFHPPRYLS